MVQVPDDRGRTGDRDDRHGVAGIGDPLSGASQSSPLRPPHEFGECAGHRGERNSFHSGHSAATGRSDCDKLESPGTAASGGNMTGIDDRELLRTAKEGRESIFNELLFKHREALHRMISARMHPRLKGRLDASDVIQETYLEATRALDYYLGDPVLPVHLWLRKLAGQKLIQAHRRHLGAQKRDADREQPVIGGVPAATSESMAIQLADRMGTPSRLAMQAEAQNQLRRALDEMSEIDREVLVMRHFEQLSGPETAEILGIGHDAVKKRYIRALERLRDTLTGLDP